MSNQSGFGVYRICFEDTFPSYYTLLMKLPVTGLGALVEGADGRGLVFQMSLPPNEFEAMSSPVIREHCTGFGMRATTFHDCTVRFTADAQLVRSTSTVSSRREWITGYTAAASTSMNTAATPVRSGNCSTPQSILMP